MNTNLGISPRDSDTPKQARISFCTSLAGAASVEQVFLCSQVEAADLQAESASRGTERTDERGSEMGAWLPGNWKGKPGLSCR